MAPKKSQRFLRLGLLVFCFQARLQALEILRLPWIFSDEPEITADFDFGPADAASTRVALALGGRFSHFGLPRGAARAPELDVHCEFVSPGSLVSHVAEMKGEISLSEVLKSSGLQFSRKHFSRSSPYVFKSEFSATVPPGDYNVIVSIEDKELSIASRRTLHVIVPAMSSQQPFLSDLKFCLGVGQALDAQGKLKSVLDPNPWRQVGGASAWELTVAYKTLGAPLQGSLWRRHSIWRLRGAAESPLWQEESPAPAKKASQFYLARVRPTAIKVLGRGIYVFKVELWPKGQPNAILSSSKTFEILP